jgi:hypothetical protein
VTSEVQADKWSPSTGVAGTIGDSGDTFTVPSGATLAIASGATIANSGTATGMGLFSSYAIIADQKTQNTAGGTFTLGAWRTRDLNTEVADPDGIVSISSNQFTLGAGSYLIRWVTITYNVYQNQSRVYNITDASVEGFSQSNYGIYGNFPWGTIRMTIAGSKTFEIQHYSLYTIATDGFGKPANIGTEQYTTVEIFKEA